MKGRRMSATQSMAGFPKSFPNLHMKYIPTGQNMFSCRECHTVHDLRLNPNAEEFIPGRLAGMENIVPSWNGTGWLTNQGSAFAYSYSAPPYTAYNSRPVLGSAKRPPAGLPGGMVRDVVLLPVGNKCSDHTGTGQSIGQALASANGVLHGEKSGEVADGAANRSTVIGPRAWVAAGGSTSSLTCTGRPGAGTPHQGGTREVNHQQNTAAPQRAGVLCPASSRSVRCDSSDVSPTSPAKTELCYEICSVRVSPKSDVTCPSTSLDSLHNTSNISKCARTPSQCNDSTILSRSNSRESRVANPASCSNSVTSPASATVVLCKPSASISDLDTPSECDAPASNIERRRSLSSSSFSISAESTDDDPSDESSDEDDSTLGAREWDASAVAFLPGSSVESADDFILFLSEDECCPTEPARPPTPAAGVPRAPVFGPCSEQADSGLSAETESSDSDAQDSSDDELSDDECEQCRHTPAGACDTHQRIAEANRQLPRWCATPPPQPRTPKVRFLSGDRLATVHAAPDYDRATGSDLLDQQRQRDRLRRWRQDVDRQVAPLLSAVLTPEHRQRVLRQRPELLRDS